MEPRLLLSGVTTGALPDYGYSVDIGNDSYKIDLPGTRSSIYISGAKGKVFHDTDGDALQDPFEHALTGVTVFADADGDRRLDPGEATTTTNKQGYFHLEELPSESIDIRVVMPDGYRPTTPGSDTAGVSLGTTRGLVGLEYALSRSGFDLNLRLSDVSMPENFETGTRVDVPVILSNTGDKAMPAGTAMLRVYVSSDRTHSGDDIRLSRTVLKRGLKPGESVKLDLSVNLPSALADFTSYLIVDAVGKGLRSDLNPADNRAVGSEAIAFKGSRQQPVISVDDINVVLGNWNTTVPYGGVVPDYGYNDGFVGIDDLNTTLGNWNAGTPPTPPPPSMPQIDSVEAQGGQVTEGIDSWIRATGVSPGAGGAIDRVLFFYDAESDGVIDDYLGVDNDGPEIIDNRAVYSVDASISSSLPSTWTGRVIAVAADVSGNRGGIYQEVAPRLGVTISAGQELVFVDAEGKRVTVRFVGAGNADVILAGVGLTAHDLGDVIEIVGHAALDGIRLEGTNGRSKLFVDVSDASGKSSKIQMNGKVTGASPVGLLSAPKVDFKGGIEMLGGGVIRNVRVGSINNITMARQGYGNGVKISAREVTGRVELGSHLRVLNAGDVSGDIVAPSAGRMFVRNDMSGRVELTDASVDQSLDLLQVNGLMSHTTLLASSSIDTVWAAEMVRSVVAAGTSTDLWRSNWSLLRNTLNRSAIQNFQAGLFTDSKVAAWRIVDLDLDRVQSQLNRSTSELIYRRLVSYQGPRGVDRTVI